MNLSTLLNDENQDANKPPRRPSGALPRQNTLPTLRTDSYRSPGGPPSRQSSFESQNPALLHSPAIQRLTRPEVAYHSQYSPGGSAQYGPINTPLSPYAISTISPGNQHQYGNRPSSHASVPSTPSSTYGQTPHTYHESPVSNYPYPNAGGSYMQHPLSQPGTPLGPPNGPFRLPSHGSRDSPSILNTLQSPSGGTHGHPVAPYRPSPQASISHIVNAPLSYDQAPAPVPLIQTNTSETDDRERSVSVSPKTVLNVLPSRLNSTSSLGQSHADISSPTRDGREARSQPAPPAPAQLNNQDQHHTTLSQGYPVSVVPRTGFLIDPLQHKVSIPTTPDMVKKGDYALQRSGTTLLDTGFSNTSAVVPTLETRNSSPVAQSKNRRPEMAEAGRQSSPILIESPKSKPQSIPAPKSASLKRSHEPEVVENLTEIPPQSKRRRFTEIPIWAQRCKHTNPLPKYRHLKTTNGTTHSKPERTEPRVIRAAQVTTSDHNDLENFEPNFINTPVYDEITRQLCDWLYRFVVMNDSLQTSSVDGASSTEGLLEIEAKLGTIMDKDGQRYSLPVETETILREGIDISFQSMMTVDQHRIFNEKLNGAFQKSHERSNPKPRAPMAYHHTNERDSFYELPLSEAANLPATLRSQILHRKPKLRVTHDLKTGKITSQIVKIRVANLHVYSPRTPFDWRVSVSAEVNWAGDVKSLMASAPRDNRNNMPDRNKDRVSYKHQHCQIDLTQVKASTAAHSESATHELEVELDATVLRREGLLAQGGQPNRYEELVRVFADNVRTLARPMG